jgi:hypothetical protein
LTFEPYCHDPELGFAKMMAEVVTDLSSETGAPVHIGGHVPALVAPSWYDDGPVDLTGAFEFLSQDSEFRNTIPSLSPEEFLRELERLFDPLPLNALSLTLVVGLPELTAHPTLISPLLPYLEKEKALPDHVMLTSIILARQAGEERYVLHTLRSWVPGYLRRILKYPYIYGLSRELLMMVAELDPSAALRHLRSSRPRGVRRDIEETGWRREVLAVAHENLARPALAQKLRETPSE